ncbi:hypothetical protein GCM10010277_67700 [Streptomyces longisporoflavus]|nr:hypothetical protein GCM10010277_67700 [Streptomyces longisporoflavus]
MPQLTPCLAGRLGHWVPGGGPIEHSSPARPARLPRIPTRFPVSASERTGSPAHPPASPQYRLTGQTGGCAPEASATCGPADSPNDHPAGQTGGCAPEASATCGPADSPNDHPAGQTGGCAPEASATCGPADSPNDHPAGQTGRRVPGAAGACGTVRTWRRRTKTEVPAQPPRRRHPHPA